jgi:hypothetical protein
MPSRVPFGAAFFWERHSRFRIVIWGRAKHGNAASARRRQDNGDGLKKASARTGTGAFSDVCVLVCARFYFPASSETGTAEGVLYRMRNGKDTRVSCRHSAIYLVLDDFCRLGRSYRETDARRLKLRR